jgi:hypothetical protein
MIPGQEGPPVTMPARHVGLPAERARVEARGGLAPSAGDFCSGIERPTNPLFAATWFILVGTVTERVGPLTIVEVSKSPV